MVVELLGTLIINAVILPIPLYIYVSSSLRKYMAFMMTAILKIFCGTKGMNSISDLYSDKNKGCRKHSFGYV